MGKKKGKGKKKPGEKEEEAGPSVAPKAAGDAPTGAAAQPPPQQPVQQSQDAGALGVPAPGKKKKKQKGETAPTSYDAPAPVLQIPQQPVGPGPQTEPFGQRKAPVEGSLGFGRAKGRGDEPAGRRVPETKPGPPSDPRRSQPPETQKQKGETAPTSSDAPAPVLQIPPQQLVGPGPRTEPSGQRKAPVEGILGFGRARGRGDEPAARRVMETKPGPPSDPRRSQPPETRKSPPSEEPRPPAGRTGRAPPPAAVEAVTRDVQRLQIQEPKPPQPTVAPPKPEPVKAAVQKPQIKYGGVSLTIPPRKGVGTLGRRTRIATNHFELSIKPKKDAIHYDVSITPDHPKRLLRRVVEMMRQEVCPHSYIAFDGRKNIYSSGELPFGREVTKTIKLQDGERPRDLEFKVTIKYASRVDLNALLNYMNGSNRARAPVPQEAIQAVDVVLRSAPAFRFVQVGRSFFTEPQGQVLDLGDGIEVWYGFYQSAICGWKPFLNVDVAHKGFPKCQDVVGLLTDLFKTHAENLNRNGLDEYQVEELGKFLRGLKVVYEIPNVPNSKRVYRVNNIMGPSDSQLFDLEGKKCTVFEYFLKEKKYRLRFPKLPCIWVGPNTKTIYIPCELCLIQKGQVTLRKLNETQTAALIKHAATSTMDRRRKIETALRQANFNSDPCLREFGLSVSDKFAEVDARILPPPALEYNQRDPVGVERGVWRPARFINGASLEKWSILNLDFRTKQDALENLARELQKIGAGLGMNILRPVEISFMDSRRAGQLLEDFFKKRKNAVNIVVVIVPDKGGTYAQVKQIAETKVGILTQCVKGTTVFRLKPATVSNLCLKINSKLGGVNHSLHTSVRPACLRKPVMIIGADVTHPSADLQSTIPSVAAVAASHDPKAFMYGVSWRFQPPKVEIIEDLENMIKDLLMYFYRKTKCKPEKLLFYRDGVSEGQFVQVLQEELTAIRRACQSLQADYKPNITFLVVQKRHHTRFFPLRPEDADGKNRNVPPGTLVDTVITHPQDLDFYLVSHQSIQGVSRPTKYRLLWDDNNMTEDEIEQLTYYLCHMYSRCTRSVSYPAPTYYAHLAAYRARLYFEGQRVNLNNLKREQESRATHENIVLNSPMYFV